MLQSRPPLPMNTQYKRYLRATRGKEEVGESLSYRNNRLWWVALSLPVPAARTVQPVPAPPRSSVRTSSCLWSASQQSGAQSHTLTKDSIGNCQCIKTFQHQRCPKLRSKACTGIHANKRGPGILPRNRLRLTCFAPALFGRRGICVGIHSSRRVKQVLNWCVDVLDPHIQKHFVEVLIPVGACMPPGVMARVIGGRGAIKWDGEWYKRTTPKEYWWIASRDEWKWGLNHYMLGRVYPSGTVWCTDAGDWPGN